MDVPETAECDFVAGTSGSLLHAMPEAGTIERMSSEGLTIRDATEGDADAMGCLHVRAWQSAYRALFRQVTRELSDIGFVEAVLWVVLENQRARSLYESEGWTADGAVSAEKILGVTVTDVRYRKSLVN